MTVISAPRGFQTAVPPHPDDVVVAHDVDDVAAAVRHAARNDLPVRVQATGHGRGPTAPGGVLVDTAAMDRVDVDPAARTARVEAGATWGAVLAAAAPHGLAAPSGSAPGVGAVGSTLAGGIGLLGRRLGYATDHVRALEVVTAEGDRARVTADSTGDGADLFRVLRGDREGPAVVTALELDLTPLATVVGGGMYLAVDDDLPAVLAAVRALQAEAPDDLGVGLGAMTLPDVPGPPPPLRGRHVLHVRLVAPGDAGGTVREAAARLRAAGTVLAGDVREMPYAESTTIHAEPETPHAYDGTAVAVGDLGADDLAGLIARAGSAPLPGGPGPDGPLAVVLGVRPLGGAFARRPAVPDAVSFRDAGFLVQVLSPVGESADERMDRPRIRAAHDAVLAPLGPVGGDRVPGRPAGFVLGRARGDTPADECHTPDVLTDVERVRARLDPRGLLHGRGPVPA